MHLWESEHDYYCNEGNYYKNDVGLEFQSWADFLAELGDMDLDMNLVFRWDWKKPDPGAERTQDRLVVFVIGQRKGKYWWASIESIRPEDEDAVRAWLKIRFDHLMRLWAPLGGEPS